MYEKEKKAQSRDRYWNLLSASEFRNHHPHHHKHCHIIPLYIEWLRHLVVMRWCLWLPFSVSFYCSYIPCIDIIFFLIITFLLIIYRIEKSMLIVFFNYYSCHCMFLLKTLISWIFKVIKFNFTELKQILRRTFWFFILIHNTMKDWNHIF